MQQIRKCLAMGAPYFAPAGSNANGPNGPHDIGSTRLWGPDQKLNSNRVWDTGAGYIRLWAPWPQFQPSPSFAPGAATSVYANGSGNTPAQFLINLDRQIETAKFLGKRVILTAWRTADWAVTDPQPPLPGGGLWTKQTGFPADLDNENGPWATWIKFLLNRYTKWTHPNNPARYIDILEICNEPNWETWYQRNPNGSSNSAVKTAKMFHLAQAVRRPSQPKLAGPATSDHYRDPAEWPYTATRWEEFTVALLDRLELTAFTPDGNFIWTHHNYRDIELRKTTDTRVGQVQNHLTTWGWRGWHSACVAGQCTPNIMITEGGARLNDEDIRPPGTSDAQARLNQASAVDANYRLMRQDTGEGQGIATHAQYLLYSDEQVNSFNDSGLLDHINPMTGGGGVTRPIHTDADPSDGILGWSKHTSYAGE